MAVNIHQRAPNPIEGAESFPFFSDGFLCITVGAAMIIVKQFSGCCLRTCFSIYINTEMHINLFIIYICIISIFFLPLVAEKSVLHV